MLTHCSLRDLCAELYRVTKGTVILYANGRKHGIYILTVTSINNKNGYQHNKQYCITNIDMEI
jgi:hypothetical protein